MLRNELTVAGTVLEFNKIPFSFFPLFRKKPIAWQMYKIISIHRYICNSKHMQPKYIYIAYYKPRGVICTTERISHNIIDAIGHPVELLPVGRLDKDSEGLILLTNNRSVIHRIIHPEFQHEKEYVVTLNLLIKNQFLKSMASGVDIGDAITKPCTIRQEPGTRRIFRIILTQGLNRQIRRMCAVFNYQILQLKRVRIMHIQLDKLKVGEWRDLSPDEVERLLSAVQ
jgi:23S rRNA pseudouridine2604 synthase